MSYTYTQEVLAPNAEDSFVPSYARRTVKSKKVKTWMVLAPIAGLALIGGAAAMLMTSSDEVQPLAEPAVAPAAVSQPAPLSSTPVTRASPIASTPATSKAPAATARATRAEAPATRVVRRSEPAQVRSASPAPGVTETISTPRITTPTEAGGPRPYEAAPAPTAETPAPAIVVAPLS